MTNRIPTQALSQASLRERVRLAIKDKIITGELEAGVLYSVGEFATALGVSTTPVREAVLDLAKDGLVGIRRNRGFVVPALSDQDLDERYQLRLMLEVPATLAAVGRLTATSAEECATYVERCRSCALAGDLGGFLDADRAFHGLLVRNLGNHRLATLLDQLRDEARLPALPKLARDGALVASADEHAVLLAAVVSGDPSLTESILGRHLRHTRGLWAGRSD